MKPTWEREGVQLYLADCREVLPHVRADAVITDPPYGVGFKYSSHNDSNDGYREWCEDWFAAIQTDGPIAISCGISNLCMWPKPTWVMCWHKPASMGRCVVGFNNWEPVLVYGKTRAGQVADVFRACIVPDEDVSWHPCPKPVAWASGIMRRIAKAGDSILDPFMGSGTTAIASIRDGHPYVGIESDADYFWNAAKRIARELDSQPLIAELEQRERQMELIA